jgi:hypothetical protein
MKLERNLSTSIDLTGSLKLPKTSEHPTEVYFENEDSNSSSVYQVSANSQQQSSYTMNKRLKSKQTAFRELSVNSPRTSSKDDLIANEATNSENVHAHSSDHLNENEEETMRVAMDCPVNGCDSLGNLDGVSERHCSFDSCPRYFSLKQEECAERRERLDKLLAEINEKSKKTADRKSIRNKVTKCLFTSIFKLDESFIHEHSLLSKISQV